MALIDTRACLRQVHDENAGGAAGKLTKALSAKTRVQVRNASSLRCIFGSHGYMFVLYRIS